MPTFEQYRHNRTRERLAQQGVIAIDGKRIHFVKDHLFSSPSAAAICVTGRTANGLVEWKDSSGMTLKDAVI